MKQKTSERSVNHIWIFYQAVLHLTIPNGDTQGYTTFTVIKYGNVYQEELPLWSFQC